MERRHIYGNASITSTIVIIVIIITVTTIVIIVITITVTIIRWGGNTYMERLACGLQLVPVKSQLMEIAISCVTVYICEEHESICDLIKV